MTEYIGIAASFIIVVSMLFKTSTYTGAFWLRILNVIGSVVFVIYGFMLPTYSTAFLNICTTVINIVQLSKLRDDYNKVVEDSDLS